MTALQVRLRRGALARVLRGHPWVFSGELETLPEGAAPGDVTDLFDARDRYVGRGFLSPGATLALRILSRDKGETFDAAFFEGRLERALALRRRLLPGVGALRLVAGEADQLPGLVVDRYGPHLVLQATTAGMERRLPEITGALLAIIKPASILARHDIPMRAREGLPLEVRQLHGETPRTLQSLGLAFDPWEGQKTGLYLDQRELYGFLKGRAEGRRILDMFCYVGGWAASALREGAREVVGVDSSEAALGFARRNAPGAAFLEANAFDYLREAFDRRERFDGIVLDPPPFVRAKEDLAKGLRGYKELNLRALGMLSPGGWLFTASCSQRVFPETFTACVREAASDAGRQVRLIHIVSQPVDHPVLLEVPETAYFKGLLLEAVT
jgi:23S rRNA (cytosine1962-C5)-methyltransferase